MKIFDARNGMYKNAYRLEFPFDQYVYLLPVGFWEPLFWQPSRFRTPQKIYLHALDICICMRGGAVLSRGSTAPVQISIYFLYRISGCGFPACTVYRFRRAAYYVLLLLLLLLLLLRYFRAT